MSQAPLGEWYNYGEFFLALDCIVLIIFNISVLVRKRVYTSWSTTQILLSCTLLLLTRAICLCYYAFWDQDNEQIETVLVMSSLITDLPAYLFMNVTLAIIWQWYRIERLLTAAEREAQEIQSGRSLMRLIWVQLVLLLVFLLDLSFIIAHYSFDKWQDQQDLSDKERLMQDHRWVIMRFAYKIIQILTFAVLLIAACVIFRRVRQALISQEIFRRLLSQTNTFILVFLAQFAVRYILFVVLQIEWSVRNLGSASYYNLRDIKWQQETSVNCCAVAELILDYFLMLYLFMGSFQEEDPNELNKQAKPAITEQSRKLAATRSEKSEHQSLLDQKLSSSDHGSDLLSGIVDGGKFTLSQTHIVSSNQASPGSSPRDLTNLVKSRHSHQNEDETVNASDDEEQEGKRSLGAFCLDRNNNVIRSNVFEDGCTEDAISLDLNAMNRLPRARKEMRDIDQESSENDVFTHKGSFSGGMKLQPKLSKLGNADRQTEVQFEPSELTGTTLKTDSQLRTNSMFLLSKKSEIEIEQPVKFFIGPGQLMQQVTLLHMQAETQNFERISKATMRSNQKNARKDTKKKFKRTSSDNMVPQPEKYNAQSYGNLFQQNSSTILTPQQSTD